jgi:hypothetical protein
MNILDNFVGAIMFEYFGAFIKWLVYAVFNLIRSKRIISYKRILEGPKKGVGDEVEILLDGFSNIVTGIISFIGLGFIISAIWF